MIIYYSTSVQLNWVACLTLEIPFTVFALFLFIWYFVLFVSVSLIRWFWILLSSGSYCLLLVAIVFFLLLYFMPLFNYFYYRSSFTYNSVKYQRGVSCCCCWRCFFHIYFVYHLHYAHIQRWSFQFGSALYEPESHSVNANAKLKLCHFDYLLYWNICISLNVHSSYVSLL